MEDRDRRIARQRHYRTLPKYIEYYRRYRETTRRARRGLPEPTRPKPDVCECCQRPPGKHPLALDHCHFTGKFRGWLCHRCNTAIGLLGDLPISVALALAYLEKHYS